MPAGSRPGVLYVLGKDYKKTKNGLTPFRPILSAIDIPSYKLAKLLLTFLTPLIQNEYTVTDSFYFTEEICKRDPNLNMASLDVDSLFTNIPLDEIIDIFLIACIKMIKTPLRFLRMFFVICLTWLPRNRFLYLTTNSMSKLMVWLWGFHKIQL